MSSFAGSAVLDASAYLAYANGERGADVVEDALAGGAAIAAPNWAEVCAKVAEVRDPREYVAELEADGLLGEALSVAPMVAEDAVIAGAIVAATRGAGLSLGDACCLAVATRLGRTALTADAAWGSLDLEPISIDVSVAVIR